MKKTLLLAICLLAVAAVNAQGFIYGPRGDYYYDPNDFYRPRIGFEAGIGMSNTIAGTTNSGAEFNTGTLKGLNMGLIFDIPVSYPFSIAPEILFSQKGYEAQTASGNFTQRTQFIEVPILAKFRLNSFISLYAGPQFSYLAFLRNSYNEGFISTNQTYYDNSSNALYMDGVIGASLNVTHNVELRARYAIDLQQNNSNGNALVPTYSNRVMQFSLGYKF